MRKKSKAKPFLIILVILLIGALGFGTYYFWNQDKLARAENKELLDKQAQNSKTAWVALTDIRAGEQLIADTNVELRQIYSGIDEYLFWQPETETSVATVDISALTPIFSSMTTDKAFSKDMRAYEVATVLPMTTQRDYDYIDIRISYPDGTDNVVVSKKKIDNLSLTNCLFTVDMREDEIINMTSAILDAFLIPGTRMYTTTYTNPTLQEPAVVTYAAKTAGLDLLSNGTNPNITESISRATLELNKMVRLALEERLGLISAEDLQEATQAWAAVTDSYRNQVQSLLETADEEE